MHLALGSLCGIPPPALQAGAGRARFALISNDRPDASRFPCVRPRRLAILVPTVAALTGLPLDCALTLPREPLPQMHVRVAESFAHEHLLVGPVEEGPLPRKLAIAGSVVGGGAPTVQAHVPDAAGGEVRVGDRANLTLRRRPKGAVMQVCPTRVVERLDRGDSARHETVRLAAEHCPNLVAGQRVEIELETRDARATAFAVPRESVFDWDGSWRVFVQHTPTEFEARAVQRTDADGDQVFVTDGIDGTERIVVGGAPVLHERLLRRTGG